MRTQTVFLSGSFIDSVFFLHLSSSHTWVDAQSQVKAVVSLSQRGGGERHEVPGFNDDEEPGEAREPQSY